MSITDEHLPRTNTYSPTEPRRNDQLITKTKRTQLRHCGSGNSNSILQVINLSNVANHKRTFTSQTRDERMLSLAGTSKERPADYDENKPIVAATLRKRKFNDANHKRTFTWKTHYERMLSYTRTSNEKPADYDENATSAATTLVEAEIQSCQSKRNTYLKNALRTHVLLSPHLEGKSRGLQAQLLHCGNQAERRMHKRTRRLKQSE